MFFSYFEQDYANICRSILLMHKKYTSIIFLSTVSLLRVRVPVLSLHRTSIPAISSIAVILFVMAPCKTEVAQLCWMLTASNQMERLDSAYLSNSSARTSKIHKFNGARTCWDNRCDPMAIVTERTVGMAIGIPPMSSTRRLSMTVRYLSPWIAYITIISMTIPTAIEQIQKFPIALKTWKTSHSG